MADAELFADLPDGWQVKRLADLASLQSGGTPSKQRPDFWQGSIPWASPKDMKRPYLFDAEDHISAEGLADGSRQVPAGSLFIVVRGMILERDIPIAMAGVPMAFNQDMKAIVPNEQVDGNFLLFALRQFREQLRRDVGSSAHGTKRIGTSAIEAFRLPLPPLPEQRAIAHVLRAVQRTKEAAEAVVASARQLKRSLLRHLFTFGPVPVAEADRVPLKETETGPIPEHWNVKRLGDIAKIGNGSTPSRSTPGFWDGGAIPWLTSGKIHERIIRHADEFVTPTAQAECHLPTVKKGSVLVAITGQGKTLGNAAMIDIDTCISQHLAYIQPHTTDVRSDYLLEYLGTRYEHFRQAANAGGSTKGALTCGYLKTYLLPLPPVPEQQLIGSIAEAADQKIQTEAARVSALGELFRSLLRDLMTGRVRVHELGLVPLKSD